MRYLLFLICILLFSNCFSQVSIKDIAAKDWLTVSTYRADTRVLSAIFLNMAYGSSTISNTQDIKRIKASQLVRIDLVYTNFPISSFNELTEKRLQSLERIMPEIFSNKSIEWNLIVQSECQEVESAKKLFHGFVLYYRDPDKKAFNQGEIDYLKSVFKQDVSGGLLKTPSFKDSTVLKVLSRNWNWKNMLFVADHTGSMSPYIAQLLLWNRLNSVKNISRHWVFFNDGDYKPDHEKVIGKTGGVYYTYTSEFDSLLELSYQTMLNGFGGDAQENDLEAILVGIQNCPECDDVVLIADNQAPVRDMKLLEQIHKPVRVILCGSQAGINTQFLEIARVTGGSVHTIEEDIERLFELNEGEVIKIGRQSFKVEGSKLKKISGS